MYEGVGSPAEWTRLRYAIRAAGWGGKFEWISTSQNAADALWRAYRELFNAASSIGSLRHSMALQAAIKLCTITNQGEQP